MKQLTWRLITSVPFRWYRVDNLASWFEERGRNSDPSTLLDRCPKGTSAHESCLSICYAVYSNTRDTYMDWFDEAISR